MYRKDATFPAIGHGLNRTATITLEKVWYINPITKQEIRDPDKLKTMNFEKILMDSVVRNSGESISYDAKTGKWVFKVNFTYISLILNYYEFKKNVIQLN